MTPPLTPNPNDPRSLTSREREILAAIEDDLTGAEPELSARMAHAGRSRPAVGLPLLLLVLALVVLCVAASLLPEWPALPVLTVGLLVPWVAFCASRARPA